MEINKRDRIELKSYFIKNNIPTESNFADFVDAVLNQKEDGIAKLPGNPLSIEAVGDTSSQKKVLNFYEQFTDLSPSWVFSLNPRSDPGDPNTAKAGFSISDSAGNSRLFIDRVTGNVGLGTTTPEDRLDVGGELRILTDMNPIRFTSKWSAFPDQKTNQAEIANDTEQYKTLMIVGNKSAGMGRRVSIWDKLEVNGDLTVTRALDFGAQVRQMINLYRTDYGIGVQSSTQYFRTAKNFAWYQGGGHNNGELNGGGGAVRMVIKDGSVGIGTAAPSHKFHVVAPDAVGLFESTGTQAYLRFSSREGLGNRVEIANRPGGRLALWTAGGHDVFNITRDGKVGVGTTNPQDKLHVVGDLLGAARDHLGAAMRVRSGVTSKTAWKQYGTTGVYVDVDTRHCGFKATPVYVASLCGNTSHYSTTGGSCVYNPTSTGFRIYVRWSNGAAMTTAQASSYGWYLHWIAVGN